MGNERFTSLKTPCFVFDEKEFCKNISNFSSILHKYFSKSIIGYSFKTNSLPRLLYLARCNSCFAEVVSDDEYKLAIEIGYKPKEIIFNGPVKKKKEFIQAIENGSLVNIDSKREVEWIVDYDINTEIKIGIRVNIDLEKKLPGHLSTGNDGGRFGFSYESGELHEVIRKLAKRPNVIIDCLHMHISNSSKSAEVYECLAREACKIIEKEEINPSYIDMGGGYFGGGDNGEEYEKYISRIHKTLVELGHGEIGIIVEPGASVVATAFSYLTRVVDTKDSTYGRFVVTDGTRLHIDPFFNKNKFEFSLIKDKNGNILTQTICGCTCLEKDRIMQITDEELEMDDIIQFQIVGSYTSCFNSLFITYLPYVYSKIDENYILVRDKWGVSEFVQKNRWLI